MSNIEIPTSFPTTPNLSDRRVSAEVTQGLRRSPFPPFGPEIDLEREIEEGIGDASPCARKERQRAVVAGVVTMDGWCVDLMVPFGYHIGRYVERHISKLICEDITVAISKNIKKDILPPRVNPRVHSCPNIDEITGIPPTAHIAWLASIVAGCYLGLLSTSAANTR
eukprot:1330982-Amorphochlora_amoeboformis.AAC.2